MTSRIRESHGKILLFSVRGPEGTCRHRRLIGPANSGIVCVCVCARAFFTSFTVITGRRARARARVRHMAFVKRNYRSVLFKKINTFFCSLLFVRERHRRPRFLLWEKANCAAAAAATAHFLDIWRSPFLLCARACFYNSFAQEIVIGICTQELSRAGDRNCQGSTGGASSLSQGPRARFSVFF